MDEKIKNIINNIVQQDNFLLVDLILRGHENYKVIEVFIDSEKNVSAEDCANISRKINKAFEDENLIKGSYRLDVSSPGVDKPLKYLPQFVKHINRKFEVSYKYGNETKKINAKLLQVDGENLLFLAERELIINFNNIIKAKVLVSFN